MKTLGYILVLFIFLFINGPATAQSTSGGENAQKEMKAEQKREKQRRDMQNRAEDKSEKVATTPQHRWLFKKKRKKKIEKTENPH